MKSNIQTLSTTALHFFIFAVLSFAPLCSAQSQSTMTTTPSTPQVAVVTIAITRFGPLPKSITIPSGPVVFFIINQSRVRTDTYSIFSGSPGSGGTLSASLLDLHSTEIRQRDLKQINLTPGNYWLSIASRSDWAINIVVSAGLPDSRSLQ